MLASGYLHLIPLAQGPLDQGAIKHLAEVAQQNEEEYDRRFKEASKDKAVAVGEGDLVVALIQGNTEAVYLTQKGDARFFRVVFEQLQKANAAFKNIKARLRKLEQGSSAQRVAHGKKHSRRRRA